MNNESWKVQYFLLFFFFFKKIKGGEQLVKVLVLHMMGEGSYYQTWKK